MKKILSIVLALSMLFAMALTANAAVSDSIMKFTSDVTEVTVGDEFTVTIKYVPGEGACFKGGSAKLEWDYAVASFVEEVEGMTDFSVNNGNINTSKNIYVIKHAMNADDANSWQSLTEEAVFSVVKFKAETVGTFTLSCGSSTVAFADAENVEKLTYKNQTMAPITITVKEPAPAGPVETRVDGAATACAKTWTAPKSVGSENTNTYTNVAVATAECEAGAKYAGFKFAQDDVNNGFKADFTVIDASKTAGEGAIEYTAVMYGVDYSRVSTIFAQPYYVIEK